MIGECDFDFYHTVGIGAARLRGDAYAGGIVRRSSSKSFNDRPLSDTVGLPLHNNPSPFIHIRYYRIYNLMLMTKAFLLKILTNYNIILNYTSVTV